jgi:hypothetical protein
MDFIYTQGSIYWKIPPPPTGGGKYQPMTFGGKNMKRREKKGENVKEKGRKRKEKGRKGKENKKKGSKRVKQMQNREELRQKGHDGSQTTCRKRGKKYNFQRGEISFSGRNIDPCIHIQYIYVQYVDEWQKHKVIICK